MYKSIFLLCILLSLFNYNLGNKINIKYSNEEKYTNVCNFRYSNIINNVNSTVQILATTSPSYIKTPFGYMEQPCPKINIGSGVILNDDGYILTNYHIINNQDTIFIAIQDSTNMQKSPYIQYIAKPISFSQSNDLALLKIISENKSSPIILGDSFHHEISLDRFQSLNKETFNITPFKLGNSDLLELGDDIFVLGYPGIGGNTLTLTKGVVSGFLDDGNFIKTDAEINSGNSGGIALNCNLEIIGITTAATISHGEGVNGKFGLIRPINNALELINNYNNY